MVLRLDEIWMTTHFSGWKAICHCFSQSSSAARSCCRLPQGTVLEPLLFLTFINDLPEVTNSEARLFADDCLLYRPIFSRKDTEDLQQDLAALEDWCDVVDMVIPS
jgi:hypothetical protein